jgi:hypothetical protein
MRRDRASARAKTADVKRLRREGIGPTEIGRRLGIGRASVYRILAGNRKSKPALVIMGLRQHTSGLGGDAANDDTIDANEFMANRKSGLIR